jgi:hypothetical protein
MPRGQHDGSPRSYSRISRPEALLFLPSSSSILLTRLSGPLSRSPVLVAPRIEPGPLDVYPGTLTSRPQRWSTAAPVTEIMDHLYESDVVCLLFPVMQ